MLTAMNNTYRGADVNTEAYFGEWLQEELEKRGWTQAELARRAKPDARRHQLVDFWPESSYCSNLRRLARALDLPAETVLKVADLLPELPAPAEDPTTWGGRRCDEAHDGGRAPGESWNMRFGNSGESESDE
jgi:hypothetical protein